VGIPDWIWFSFILAFGCCIGSFLNVVVYRLPRDKSLVRPPSACPACGKEIRFYDNVPLFSWLVLGGKCRNCKARISVRYFAIELLTGLCFLGVFILYFRANMRAGIGPFVEGGGWFIYLLHIILLASFIAASAIDLELWVIPLSICWFVTAAGLIGSAVGPYILGSARIGQHFLLPSTSDILLSEVQVSSLAGGGLIGLMISWVLLRTGLIKGSYESEEEAGAGAEGSQEEPQFNDRLEVCKEIVFLLPVIVCSVGLCWLSREGTSLHEWVLDFSQKPVISGLLGSLWGYFVGCGVVWATRIFGTLGFGKEAMGLGDVHLMGAAGAVIGPIFVVVAFFVAPFFGLGWAGAQMFFKKIRQIPYGPFLSLGVLAVMILHDRILDYFKLMFLS